MNALEAQALWESPTCGELSGLSYSLVFLCSRIVSSDYYLGQKKKSFGCPRLLFWSRGGRADIFFFSFFSPPYFSSSFGLFTSYLFSFFVQIMKPKMTSGQSFTTKWFFLGGLTCFLFLFQTLAIKAFLLLLSLVVCNVTLLLLPVSPMNLSMYLMGCLPLFLFLFPSIFPVSITA